MKIRLIPMQFPALGLVAAALLFGNGHAQENSSALNIGYTNVHLGVQDPAKAVAWYVDNLSAQQTSDIYISYGGVTIAMQQSETAAPPSEGSGIDHIGLTVTDVDATVRKLAAAGAKVLSPAKDLPGLYRHAFVEDPFGAKLELIQDQGAPQFHHVHLRVSDPAATLDWYESLVGGERTKLQGQIEGLRYSVNGNPDATTWLFAEPSHGSPLAPTAGRAIRNVAWFVSDMDASLARFSAKDVKVLRGPFTFNDIVRVVYFEDPDGISVELLQRLQ